LTLAATPSAYAAPSSADRAATDAYLQAKYTLTKAVLENAPASRAAVQTFADTLGHECAGVLAGAPRESGLLGLRAGHLPTARERGESDRRRRQLQGIQSEYESALVEALYAPDLAASTTFTQAVAPLRWSDPRITMLVGEDVSALQELLAAPSAGAVCGDLHSWQQSGYRTLPAGTLAFEARQEARAHSAAAAESLPSLLAPDEGAPEKALERRSKALQRRFAAALVPLGTISQQLARALGLEAEGRVGERKRSTIVGEGRTLSGGHYKLSVEAHEPGDSCGVEISTRYTAAPRGRRHSSVSWGSGTCLSTRNKGQVNASVQCQSQEGLLEVQARLPAATRHVLLRLSDGRTVVSPAAIVPKRLRGPIALYYQVLDGPTPYPISITAVNATGMSLKTLALDPVRHCRAEPAHREGGPSFTTLTHGTTTTGVSFTVVGVLVRFGHHRHSFNLEVDVSPTGPDSNSSSSSSIELISTGSPEAAARIRDARIFTPRLSDECPPHEFAIVYGLLARPGESVLARTASGLTPLQLVAIPARRKAGGELAYGSFATIPSEVIVQGPGGRTLFSESLKKQAREHAEYCQGYEAG
jgi:hypothetical protein